MSRTYIIEFISSKNITGHTVFVTSNRSKGVLETSIQNIINIKTQLRQTMKDVQKFKLTEMRPYLNHTKYQESFL